MAATPTPAVKDGAHGTSLSRLARLGDAMIEHPATTLLAVWLLQMAYLGVLQLAGLPFGFAVWPMGEDRNWLRFMLDGSGLQMMHEFWRVNDRNPLSPWWYWLFSWPIFQSDWGLYAVRKLVDPLLAVSATLLTRSLFRQRADPRPLLLGLLVLTCNFTSYLEQIVWNFLAAQAIALMAIHGYVRYVDSPRVSPNRLGVALLLFMCAIATYTLQIGVLIAIAAVALLRAPTRGGTGSTRGIYRERIGELLCFVALAAIFLAIWYTTIRPTSSYYMLDIGLMRTNVSSSIRQFLWHPDFTHWIGAAFRDPITLAMALPVVAMLALITIVVVRVADSECVAKPATMLWILVLLAGIGVPIVALESTSEIWLPGARSRMVYQVSTPLLSVLLISAIGWLMRHFGFARGLRAWLLGSFVGVLICAVPASLEYNKQLVAKSEQQRRFAKEFERLAARHYDINTFLIRYDSDPAIIWGSDSLSDTYAKTILRRHDVTMRFLQRQPAPARSNWRWWRVVLGSNQTGIRNSSLPALQAVPYSTVLFASWDGEHLTVPATLDRSWFEGLQVDWRRSGAIVQKDAPIPPCPVTFDFSTAPPKGDGWSVPERDTHGGYAMWMSSTRASMELRTTCTGPVEVSLAVVGYMAEDILNGLALRIDGATVPLRHKQTGDGRLQLIGRTVALPGNGRMVVTLDAPRTIVPAGGNRQLAVMFDRIVVAPSEPGSGRKSH